MLSATLAIVASISANTLKRTLSAAPNNTFASSNIRSPDDPDTMPASALSRTAKASGFRCEAIACAALFQRSVVLRASQVHTADNTASRRDGL
jgi:hypothetical protein